MLTPEELYQRLSIDNLYFIATHGGVCFGGGEPLLRVDFIKAFRQLCGCDWAITVETSLNVPTPSVEAAAEVVDDFIVDIKDCNPNIYQAYTTRTNELPLANLKRLIELIGEAHIIVRIPSIPNHNTPDDVAKSVALVKSLGITRIDQFDYIIREKEEEKAK